jgi:gliding motility-associated-like protein
MKALLLTFGLSLSYLALFAQPLAIPKRQPVHNHNHDHATEQTSTPTNTKVSFIKNLNQWHPNVAYKAPLGGLNMVYLEQQTFTYIFANTEDVGKIHEANHDTSQILDIRMHAYKVHFKNSQNVNFRESDPHKEYHNYFLGNDPKKWASNVPIFDKVRYQNLYEGIDLDSYNSDGHFKYDLIVAPHVDPNIIEMYYEGADAVEIDNSNLVIHTSVETIIEQKPYVYQIINDQKVVIPCEYELKGNTVSFVFPEGYNENYSLVIDPTVVAATLSGMSGSYNFGHTATFDNQGNIYAGGRSFGVGYQTTIGAFQTTYGGGNTDIAVTKYNPDGTAQVYATYIGGSEGDFPHSMITDFSGQLYILGTTESSNYPVTGNAFQTSKGLFQDIVVTKLNASGSALVGSTFVGGSGNDGQNVATLNSNYDDTYRGEIVLDNQGNAYIASCTNSDNFPVTAGAFDTDQNVNGISTQDGVVFKLNSDLSTLFWATYLGGSNGDAAFGIRVDDFGLVYVVGIAGSANFPTTSGTVQPNWAGGQEDAFVTILNPTGSALIASTLWGSSGDEHGFFLDIDEDGNIHIYGQTTGQMPITPNTYFYNQGSRQFLTSFSSNLSTIIYSTVIGNGPNVFGYDYVPVAFMVDKCNNIYFSGYYAQWGLPTTPNAISNVGGTVYLGVLDPMATSLQFGTYYGNADHVDGGTSRFDKSGTVYQGVCSCTSSGILNTLPGAFAETQSTFCDIGVFKIDFDIPTVTAASIALPATSGCVPFEVDFLYTGQDATLFLWDFDDNGATATTQNASHTYTEPGTYIVELQVANSLTCNSTDVSYLVIDVLDASSTLTDTTICNPDETIFLDATTTNASYSWQDGSTGATYSANGQGVYWVDVELLDGACTRRDSFVVLFNNSLSLDLGPDFSVCDENSYVIDATTPGAVSYEWQNGSTSPTLAINSSGSYSVSVYDTDGCVISDNIDILFGETPVIDLGPDTTLCDLYTVTLDPEFPATGYTWQDGSTASTFTVIDPGVYWVDVNNNGCIGSDTIEVSYLAEVFLDIESFNIDCFENCDGSVEATITGGNGELNFLWNTGATVPDLFDLCPGDYTLTITDDLCNYVLTTINITEPGPLFFDFNTIDVSCFGDQNGLIEILNITGGTPPYLYSFNGSPFSDNPVLDNLNGGNYDFVLTDANGCTTGETISIYEPPSINVSAGPDHKIELGESVELDGFVFPITNQNISWSPSDSLSCTNCIEPIANPTSTTTYTLTVIDSITGCTIIDEVLVEVIKNRNVFIPNVFTPNGDGSNDLFTIFTGNGVREILDFKVYNRWGALVYEANHIYPANHQIFGWDGYFKGKLMNDAVFTWYAEVDFLDNEVILYKGDVTLVK